MVLPHGRQVNGCYQNGIIAGRQLDDELKRLVADDPRPVCALLGLKFYHKRDDGTFITDRWEDGEPRKGCIIPQVLRITSLGGIESNTRIYEVLCEQVLHISRDQWMKGRELLAEAYNVRDGQANGEPSVPRPAPVPAVAKTASSRSEGLRVWEDDHPITRKYAPKRIESWCALRPEICPEAVELAGGKIGQFANELVVALPIYNPDLSWCNRKMWPVFRKLVPPSPGKNGIVYPGWKSRSEKGGKVGLLPLPKPEALTSAKEVWATEGETDELSLLTAWLREGKPDGHAFASSSHGAGKFPAEWGPKFKGKIVNVVPDTDRAGEEGGKRLVEFMLANGATVRYVRLPCKDTRIFLRDHTFADMCALAEQAELLSPGAEQVEPAGPESVEESAPDAMPQPKMSPEEIVAADKLQAKQQAEVNREAARRKKKEKRDRERSPEGRLRRRMLRRCPWFAGRCVKYRGKKWRNDWDFDLFSYRCGNCGNHDCPGCGPELRLSILSHAHEMLGAVPAGWQFFTKRVFCPQQDIKNGIKPDRSEYERLTKWIGLQREGDLKGQYTSIRDNSDPNYVRLLAGVPSEKLNKRKKKEIEMVPVKLPEGAERLGLPQARALAEDALFPKNGAAWTVPRPVSFSAGWQMEKVERKEPEWHAVPGWADATMDGTEDILNEHGCPYKRTDREVPKGAPFGEGIIFRLNGYAKRMIWSKLFSISEEQLNRRVFERWMAQYQDANATEKSRALAYSKLAAMPEFDKRLLEHVLREAG
jgi:hypothetical protein